MTLRLVDGRSPDPVYQAPVASGGSGAGMASQPRISLYVQSVWDAASAWGQALRRAKKTCLAEVTRPIPLVLGGQEVLVSP